MRSIWQTSNGIKALTVPAFDDLLSGRVSISQLRAVELDDLLGRDPVQLDDAGLHEQADRQGRAGHRRGRLHRFRAVPPDRTFCTEDAGAVEAGELALYNMEQELNKTFPQLDIVYLAGDVRDDVRLEQVFAEYKPNVVFHAAAYKHVPLMERHNAWQAVRNNVFGTWRVASCAQTTWRGKIRADLHRQGGQPDQRDGHHQAHGRDRLPGAAAAGTARALSSCASAMCWAATAA